MTIPAGLAGTMIKELRRMLLAHEDGRPLGVVRGTLWNGAHDVAEIDGADGRERLIPLVPDFVLNVDAPARKMKVRWEDDVDDDDG